MKRLFLILTFCLTWVSFAWAQEPIKPFILAQTTDLPMEAAIEQTRTALEGAGFSVVGLAQPYQGAAILVATNENLKKMAAQSTHGAFGAMVRVSLSETAETLQIAYTNPPYWHAAYRMEGNPISVTEALKTALGAQKEFGPEEGLTTEDLREYHYMFSMPYFDDVHVLAEYESHDAALEAVEAALAQNAGGVGKVYRIDLPDKQESVFGVSLHGNEYNDAKIMGEVDFKELKSTAHLPYEFIVTKGKALALSAKFRIAISFPDLAMMGDNSFMNIMDSPDDIQAALTAAAGGAED